MTSKVGSEKSLRSYLRQETACSELVADHPAMAAFQRLFAVRDGWVQTSRYLLGLDGDPVDQEVVDRVRYLWDLVEPNVRAKLAVDRHATFEALAGPNPDVAADTAFALNPGHATGAPERWLTTTRRLLDEQRDLLARVMELPDLVARGITPGLRRLLVADAHALVTARGASELSAGILELLNAIDRACGDTPPSILNLDVRLHGALNALRRGDAEGFAERLARSQTFSMELTSVTRARGGLLLSGELTAVDGLAPKHLVKRLRTGHQRIAQVNIDQEAPHRWTATIGPERLAVDRKHRINVIGRIGAEEEMFHLTHAEGLGNHQARMVASTVQLLAPRDRFVVHVRWTMRVARARRVAGRLRRWLASG